MSPHSLRDSDSVSGFAPAGSETASSTAMDDSTAGSGTSRLTAADPECVHDLICVGFGPASLAIAVALHDALEAGQLPADAGPPKVLFLEKQPSFSWHAGMLLPGARMQISFLKDLATLRDPRSRFTFLNFLHSQGRLVEFINLGTFLPSRSEYQDYLCWAASFFNNVVQYNSEVLSISPGAPATDDAKGLAQPVKEFVTTCRDTRTGDLHIHRARHVIVAIGGQPSVPRTLPAGHPRVIHSSQYAHTVPKILTDPTAEYRVAVIGAGQSAAEIFSHIHTLFPRSKTWLVMKSDFLRPSDDSPFINSIFNPDYVDWLYPRSPHHRSHLFHEAKATNYSVVRLELIEKLYETMYEQRRALGADETKWPHRILGGRQLIGAEPTGDSNSSLRLRLRPAFDPVPPPDSYADDAFKHAEAEETLEVDLIIAATGYKRTAHLSMLADVLDGQPPILQRDSYDVKSCSWPDSPRTHGSGASTNDLVVGRNYKVTFPGIEVADDAGIWLQGCCEDTHGISDTLLSVLSTRSGEIVRSIFGPGSREVATKS